MPDYNLLAAGECPAIVVPASLLDPAAGTPLVASALVAGDTSAVLTKLNTNASRLDLAGRWGGGGYAVATGLDLTAGAGLTLNISAGQAVLDGVAHVGAATTLALTDAAYNWVWILQNGSITKTTSATTTPPAAPSAACAFLGRVYCTGGVISTIDYSGRLELRGGTLYRRTGDSGAPGDAPPAKLQFLAQTAGGRYWWDGAAYTALWEPLALNADTIAAAEKVVIPAGYQVIIADELTVNGELTINGKLVVESF